MNKEIQEQFMRLANALSPENLHCDGEISRAEANRKYTLLKTRWHLLEAQVGRTVTESEVIGNHYGRTY